MAPLFTDEEAELLTRVGPGTPMGELMRRYWLPAFLSEKLPPVNSDPIPVKLLGEELVAFRGSDGQVGLMDRYCPHRGVSLVLARNEDCALRCIYHGWKINHDGQVLETPPEPENSKFAASIRHKAYPTREAAGMVWTYMGPPEHMPPFPELPMNGLPESHLWPSVFHQPSSWLQGLEGDVDAGHAPYLHWSEDEYHRELAGQKMGRFLFDPRPMTAVARMDWGLQIIMRYILEDEQNAAFWAHPFIMPFHTLFSWHWNKDDLEGGFWLAWVPCDDDSHEFFGIMWSDARPLTDDDKALMSLGQVGELEKNGPHEKNLGWVNDGRYGQDREAMRANKTFSGIEGVMAQDLAIQHSMGAIVDRSKEHLGVEDFTVIQTRRYLLEALKKFERGEELPGLQGGMDYRDIDYRWVVAPSETPIHDVIHRRDLVGDMASADADTSPDRKIWTPVG